MTTPTHYLRANLKRLLGKNKYFLYHWTSVESAENILKEGHLYSKAMLFGLYYNNKPAFLRKLKPSDILAEAKNGFIDYVFLGNTNWLDKGMPSYYGQVCFVIKPEKVLLTKEFFVFPFNTGRAFSTSSDQDKTCDVRTLIEALEQQHPSFEILVRRRIRINPENTAKIICPAGYKERIEQIALQKGLEISTETLDEVNILKEGSSLEFVDPLDKQKNLITLGANEYLQEKGYIYVKTQYSNFKN